MLEISGNLAAATASLVTLVWRLRTDTKRYETEWWMFVLGHLANILVQLAIAVGRISWM